MLIWCHIFHFLYWFFATKTNSTVIVDFLMAEKQNPRATFYNKHNNQYILTP